MVKFKRPDYCAQPTVESCQICSLVNYGRDCMNNPIGDTKKGMILRLPENKWKEFKHQLLSDDMSAQQWFEKQVEAYLRAGKPGGR